MYVNLLPEIILNKNARKTKTYLHKTLLKSHKKVSVILSQIA